MRITILAHPEHAVDECFGSTVGQVAAGLRKGSHRVSVLGVHDQIGRLISGLKRRQPDLVFNLMEREPTVGPRSAAVVGLLELLGLPYTGNCPGEFYIQDDARITRKLLGFRDESAHDSNGHAAKEFRVGIIGDDEPCAFDPVEVRELGLPAMRSCAPSPFGRAPMEGFATLAAAKFRQDLLDAAVATYRTLRVRDFGLVELRVHDRRIEPVGVRTDCDLGENSELARSAAAAGICHAGLVNRIAESALTRSEQHQLARLV